MADDKKVSDNFVFEYSFVTHFLVNPTHCSGFHIWCETLRKCGHFWDSRTRTRVTWRFNITYSKQQQQRARKEKWNMARSISEFMRTDIQSHFFLLFFQFCDFFATHQLWQLKMETNSHAFACVKYIPKRCVFPYWSGPLFQNADRWEKKIKKFQRKTLSIMAQYQFVSVCIIRTILRNCKKKAFTSCGVWECLYSE